MAWRSCSCTSFKVNDMNVARFLPAFVVLHLSSKLTEANTAAPDGPALRARPQLHGHSGGDGWLAAFTVNGAVAS